MKITAVTTDQIILVDGEAAQMRTIGGFEMTNGEWAVQFDTALGYGHIEYTDNRPNKTIDQAYFDEHFAWLITEHQRFIDHQAAEAQANESETADITGDADGGATAS